MWTGPIAGTPTPGRRAFEHGGVWTYVPEPRPLAQAIRAELLNALAYTGGDVRAAAECLGITERQLRYAMQSNHVPSEARTRSHGCGVGETSQPVGCGKHW